jgi:hypothetical protein
MSDANLNNNQPDIDSLLQPPLPREQTSAGQSKDQQYETLRREAGFPPLRPPHVTKRKYVWPVDVFLYPASGPCLISIGIIIAVPFLVNVAAGLLGPFGIFISIPGLLLIKIPILLFLLWYFSECIGDSAQGGVRAPEIINTDSEWGQVIRLLFTWLIFWLPPLSYTLFKYPPHKILVAGFTLPEGKSLIDVLVYLIQNDKTFCLLWFYAIYFSPMGLLSVILSDSLDGLNPLLIIRAIFRTFFKYFLIMMVFHIPAVILFGIIVCFPYLLIGLQGIPLRFAWIWLLLIVGHLIGRYYYRNEGKLYLDVSP